MIDWSTEYKVKSNRTGIDLIELYTAGSTRGPPPEDVVRSRVTNTERMEPSHDIKDIIKHHQPAGTTTSTGPATQK